MSLFPYAAISAPPKPAQTDSLLTLLPKTPDAADRGRIYVQLADLSGDSLELAAPYWEAALAEAHKAGDTYGCKDALDFLVRKFADRDTRRAEKYIALSDSILPGSRHALFRSSLYAYYLWKQMNDNNSIETVTRALEELKGKNYDRLTPEERIEWVYDVLHKGSETAREEAARTLHDVHEAMKINYFEDRNLIASQAALYREKLG